MPTYDYACQACDHAFEEFQSMSAKPLRKCPACGKMKLKRLIGTGAGVIFKGSGFYETDYRSESYKKSADAEKKSSDGGDKKADAVPDTKPGAGASASAKAADKPSKPAASRGTDANKPGKPAKEGGG